VSNAGSSECVATGKSLRNTAVGFYNLTQLKIVLKLIFLLPAAVANINCYFKVVCLADIT
jgi:hypothetical protein